MKAGQPDRKELQLTPKGIIETLNLRRPIYKESARNGHFGRELPNSRGKRLTRLRPSERRRHIARRFTAGRVKPIAVEMPFPGNLARDCCLTPETRQFVGAFIEDFECLK